MSIYLANLLMKQMKKSDILHFDYLQCCVGGISKVPGSTRIINLFILSIGI